MNIEKLENNCRPSGRDVVRVKCTGNVTELMWIEKRNNKMYIRKVDSDHYIDLREEPNPETGEPILHKFHRIENRAQNKSGVAKSLALGRDLLNTNVTDVTCCRWVTLTYADNMTDPKRLYEDFKNFNKRLRYKLGEKYEYIVAMEPQGRGAWHAHVVMIFSHKAPFIPNHELAEIWGHGFVTIKRLDDVDNVGAYLTAYLGDIDLQEAIDIGQVNLPNGCSADNISGDGIKEVEIDVDGEKIKKKYIKGGRLHMYPPKFNIFRYSRGIKKPVIELMSSDKAEKKVSADTLTFEKTLRITNGDNFESLLNYRYYNSKREKSQE
ncbi:MAG: hypothetical protein ACI4RU_08185 [Acutalibacteraceae bacterium]